MDLISLHGAQRANALKVFFAAISAQPREQRFLDTAPLRPSDLANALREEQDVPVRPRALLWNDMTDVRKDQMCLVFMPPLVALLYKAESTMGGPLTEKQVLTIRDAASCIILPYDLAKAGEKERGYSDIAAEDVWNEWQRARLELFQDATRPH